MTTKELFDLYPNHKVSEDIPKEIYPMEIIHWERITIKRDNNEIELGLVLVTSESEEGWVIHNLDNKEFVVMDRSIIAEWIL